MIELIYFDLPRVSVTGKILWSSEFRSPACNTGLTNKAASVFIGGIDRFGFTQLAYRLEKLRTVKDKLEHVVSPFRKYKSPNGLWNKRRQLLNIFDHYFEFVIAEEHAIELELESRANRESDTKAVFLGRRRDRAARLKSQTEYRKFKKIEEDISKSFRVDDPIMYALRSVPPELKPPLRRRIEEFCRSNNGKITGPELRRIYSVTSACLTAKVRAEVAGSLSRCGILPRVPAKKRKPIAQLERLLQYALESGREIYELSDDGSLQGKAITFGLDDIDEAIDYCREGLKRIRKTRRQKV
jgi:hypothetical protein